MNTEHTLGRRKMLGLIAGAGAVALGACRNGSDKVATDRADTAGATTSTSGAGSSVTDATTPSTGASSGTFNVGEIPDETAGPFPGDGTNGPNLLTQSGVVRSDIRRSIGRASATAAGVVLDVQLKIVDGSTGTPLPGAAVYLWHTDRDGLYSMYNESVADENYLRGVQAADGSGDLRFRTIFPGAYDGRWPHMHFEVFESARRATTGRNARKISQLALPEATCREVYATSGYRQSLSSISDESIETDFVFSDGFDRQLAKVTGSPGAGYVATLIVGV